MTPLEWVYAVLIIALWVTLACELFHDARCWLSSRSSDRYVPIDEILRPGSTLVLVTATGEELELDVDDFRWAGWDAESILRTFAGIRRIEEMTAA